MDMIMSESESSESDTEDTSSGPGSVTNAQQQQQSLRFECPDDFIQVEYNKDLSSVAIEDIGSNKELWLIRTPYSNFDPSKFDGQTFIMNGMQSVRHGNDSDMTYEVHSSTTEHAETDNLTILLPSRISKQLVPAPPISGQMSFIQSIIVPPMHLPPPSKPKFTELPDGLKLRYKPFGSTTPRKSRKHKGKDKKHKRSLANENTTESDATKAKDRKKKKKDKEKEKKHKESSVLYSPASDSDNAKTDKHTRVKQRSSLSPRSPKGQIQNDLSVGQKPHSSKPNVDFVNIELKSEQSTSNNETAEEFGSGKKKSKRDRKRKLAETGDDNDTESKIKMIMKVPSHESNMDDTTPEQKKKKKKKKKHK
ncbi:uncharacterized protein LOC144440811 [Glandiceps talaboti]